MSSKTKTTIGFYTVSTVVIGDVAEVMVFDSRIDDECDSIRVPVTNASKAHKHMVALYKLGDLASYYSKSVGESVTRSALRGNVRVIQAH